MLHGTLLPAWWLAATAIDARAPATRTGSAQLEVAVPFPLGPLRPAVMPPVARPPVATPLERPPNRLLDPVPLVRDALRELVGPLPLTTSDLPPDAQLEVWQVRAPRQPDDVDLPDEVMQPVMASAEVAPLVVSEPVAPAAPAPAEPAADHDPGSDAGAETEARPLADNPAPRYPGLARRRGWEGEVLLEVAVDAEGRPTEVTIETGSGRRVLDEAAASAVFGWRFEPASSGGVPVAGRTTVRVAFVLED
jgi:protein TonB